MNHKVYRNTYLHMLGMRMTHYSHSNNCSLTQALNKKENKGFKERHELLRSDKLYWLNYAASNLQQSQDIDKGLYELSKFCEIKEKKISKIESFLYDYGWIRYQYLVEVPSDPKLISLEEILKYDFFKTGT